MTVSSYIQGEAVLEDHAMKVQITTAALILAVVPALAQSARTGVSNPDPVVITTTDDSAPTPVLTPRTQAAKPSAGTPAAAPGADGHYEA